MFIIGDGIHSLITQPKVNITTLIILHTIMTRNYIKIISFNAQGLCEDLKFHKIKQHLLCRDEDRPDICTFQETKWSERYAIYHAQSFPGRVIFAHAKDLSGGVVLGVSNRSGLEIFRHVKDTEGRFIVAECGTPTEKFTLASVYLKPKISISELNECLGEISKEVLALGNSHTIWIGDFNNGSTDGHQFQKQTIEPQICRMSPPYHGPSRIVRCMENTLPF